jgi:hypothetical protein
VDQFGRFFGHFGAGPNDGAALPVSSFTSTPAALGTTPVAQGRAPIVIQWHGDIIVQAGNRNPQELASGILAEFRDVTWAALRLGEFIGKRSCPEHITTSESDVRCWAVA